MCKYFRLFFPIISRSRTVLGHLTGKKKSYEKDFDSSTNTVGPLELKLFVKNLNVLNFIL